MGERQNRPQTLKVGLVEVLDRDGHARWSVPVAEWPVTVGRAVDCDVVLEDPHVAAHHATIDEEGGVLSIEAAGTRNGVRVGAARLASGERAAIGAGDLVEIGATRLRVRRPSDAVAPELPLESTESRSGLLSLAAMLVALAAWALGGLWLRSDPGLALGSYAGLLFGFGVGLLAWCVLWALGSKLFRHRFDLVPHLRIASRYLLASSVAAAVLPILAFTTGWVIFSRVAQLASGAIAVAMVAAHLGLIVPTRRRLVAGIAAVAFALVAAALMARHYQVHDRLFGERYVATIAPPVLRLAAPVAPATFIEESRRLKDALDRHVSDDDAGEPGGVFD